METINTTAVVNDGRIVIEVPAADGTSVDVMVRPHRKKDVKAILERLDRFVAAHPLPAPDPEALRAMEEEGRRA